MNWCCERESGAALLELALLLTFLSIMAGGVINFSWTIYEQGIFVDIARESARYAATKDLNQTLDAQSRANALLLQLNYNPADFTINKNCEQLFPLLPNPVSVYGIRVQIQKTNATCFLMCTGNETSPTATSVFRLEGVTPDVCN